ncbi:MAG: DUF2301 domain-containing membrane protein [Nitrospiraceae bacterium]|nr:DUF2301 domain-containing membrane protein [Nitrospiraceae bacterium]
MGDYYLYQPLTRADKATVVLYRTGIVLTCLLISGLAVCLALSAAIEARGAFNLFLGLLYFSVGLSVFFIHLYIGRFRKNLKGLYFTALAALAFVVIKGRGDALSYIAGVHISGAHIGPLLLLPIAGCIGFIAAKEAFCFRLVEGYLLALAMPLYLIAFSAGVLGSAGVTTGLMFIAALMVLFTARKAFMPLHADIGDKSAYR